MNLIEKAKQLAEGVKTLSEWLGSGGETVGRPHAQQRANVCLKCPNNVREGAFTEAVALAIKKQLELKNHLELRVTGEKRLHTCQGCGCALRLKIHVPLKNLGLDAEELKAYPDPCWMRNEVQLL